MMKEAKLLTAMLVLSGLLLFCCSSSEETETPIPDPVKQISQTPQPATETKADQAASFSVYDLDGALRHSSEWLGKNPVVLNFWGTWCPPCRREIPELVELYAEYKGKGVEIIGIALERQAGTEQIKQFAQQYKMDWVLTVGNQQIVEAYEINPVPVLIFIDAQGNQISRHTGLQTSQVMRAGFESIL